MASQLIQFLRLMIEAYLFDGAQQNESESEPFGLMIESTTVLEGFIELMQYLEPRKERDTRLRSIVEEATRGNAKQLNEAILFDARYLRSEDEKLLRESMDLVRPNRQGTRASTLEEMNAATEAEEREILQLRYALAQMLRIDVSEIPRWLVEEQARKQDVEVLLLKYILIRIAQCRKNELYRDMLRLDDLHEDSRYAFKRTAREAFLCRVFGFDQAAASLCGAALESELARRLHKLGVIELRRRNRPFGTRLSKFPGHEMTAFDMLGEVHSMDLLRGNALYEKGERVLNLRNDALHDPSEFNRKLKLDEFKDFILSAREVLEGLQEQSDL